MNGSPAVTSVRQLNIIGKSIHRSTTAIDQLQVAMPPVAEKTSGVKEARSISRTRRSILPHFGPFMASVRVVPIGEVTYERAKGLNTLTSNNARS